MTNRTWEDSRPGDVVGPLLFPLTVYRLVLAAGSNFDFTAIHHNSEFAKASGAPEMYANTLLLQGMWERTVRDYIGLGGTIRRLSGFRMRRFNCVGETVIVKGEVLRKWLEDGVGLLEIKLWSENAGEITVGPGSVIATMPVASAG